jgi:hypothetical protein
MKPYRIGNDIVAARDAQEAIACWAKHYRIPAAEAGPAEEVSTELDISVEQADGSFRDGTLADVMPVDGEAEIVCLGHCEECDS